MPYSGIQVVCSTVQHITEDKAHDPKYQELLCSYNKQIEKMTNAMDKVINLSRLKPWDLIDIDFSAKEFNADVIPEADKYDVSTHDKYVGAKVDMPRGGEKPRVKMFAE